MSPAFIDHLKMAVLIFAGCAIVGLWVTIGWAIWTVEAMSRALNRQSRLALQMGRAIDIQSRRSEQTPPPKLVVQGSDLSAKE